MKANESSYSKRGGIFGTITALVTAIAIVSAVLLCVYIDDTAAETYDENGIDVMILMYHNIIADGAKPSKYEINFSTLREDMKYLQEKGYRSIDSRDLIAYTQGKKTLPAKCVMLTFDDGYYSYMRYIPKLLDEFGMKAVVSVVGDYTRLNKNNPNISKKYTYLDFDDIGELSRVKGVEIALHSYDFHNIDKTRKGAARAKGESEEEYAKTLTADSERLIDALEKVGVECVTYAYPYWSYSKSSDKILAKLGVKCTLTCNEGVNIIKKGDDLGLLMRYNRDGRWKSVEEIAYFRQR